MSALNTVLTFLRQQPLLTLSVKELRVRYAYRGHIEASKFTKQFLPRIQYANPALRIGVEKISYANHPPETSKTWLPTLRIPELNLVLPITNDPALSLHSLMYIAGDDKWKKYKDGVVKHNTALSHARRRVANGTEEGEVEADKHLIPDALLPVELPVDIRNKLLTGSGDPASILQYLNQEASPDVLSFEEFVRLYPMPPRPEKKKKERKQAVAK